MNETATAGRRRRAFSYIRFSTPEQALGDSERRQLNAVQAYCDRQGLKLVDTFADKGVSAFHGAHRENGALGRLLKHVKPGDVILIEDTDRWSREDPLDALTKLREQVNRGIEVVFLRTGTRVTKDNFNDPQVLYPNFFGAVLGNAENRKKSERVAAAWEAKRKRIGKEKMTACCPSWLKLSEDRQRFEVIPDKAEVVRRMFRLGSEGKGAWGIACQFNQEKVPTLGGAKHWYSTIIRKCLLNRAVLGEFVPTKNGAALPPICGYYPRIITPSLFATVTQSRIVRPDQRGRRSLRNPFGKLIFDPKGHRMTYQFRKTPDGKGRYEYLVSEACLLKLAPWATWKLDHFKAAFLWLTQKASLSKPPEQEQDDNRLAEARMELLDAEKGIKRLLDVLERVKSKDAETRLTELDAKKEQLTKRIADLEIERQAKPVTVDMVNWEDPEALRSNMLRTCKRITMDAKDKWFRVEFLDGRRYGYREIITEEALHIIYEAPKGEIRELGRQAKEGMKGIDARYAAWLKAKRKVIAKV
jgi:DNA invertase Pin-like site-specific DNA recombinase